MPASASWGSSVLLERIRLTNLLSFGPQAEELELRPLNVLIGANGSGKSNFIDAIGLLQAMPTNLAARVGGGRGVADWVWQGDPEADSAVMQAVIQAADQKALRYSMKFGERLQRFAVVEERLEAAIEHRVAVPPFVERGENSCVAFLCRNVKRQPQLSEVTELPLGYDRAEHPVEGSKSVLAQVKDAEHYPELTYLAKDLKRIRLYRGWSFGQSNVVRSLQTTGHPNTNLAEDHANLGLVLNRLSKDCAARERIVEALHRLYEDISDFHVNVEFNTVRVSVQERGGKVVVPATRLSDGTIRDLSLLAILCDPQPPPLVCIEEPELGLHPDILPGLAKLLREASERCQLIVTTHSEVLVDALTDEPESIVVCEKENGQTKLKRLSRAELRHGLDKHRLGELWSSGEIGGNRW